MHTAQAHQDKLQIARSQIKALMCHLRQGEQHPDGATERRFLLAQALLYEVAEALGVDVGDEQEARSLCAAA